jgi:hypothetical protein
MIFFGAWKKKNIEEGVNCFVMLLNVSGWVHIIF